MAHRTDPKGTQHAGAHEKKSSHGLKNYWRFFAMIATSTAVMFILMYLNTYAWEQIFWSETRFYMAFVMGATMAVIMLAYMLGMYRNLAINVAVFAGSVIVFAGALWLVRSQTTVGETSYMRAMIPHHSIALLTSKRANIAEPRVRKLADEIIVAQEREIAEMRYLIAELDEGNAMPPEADGEAPAPEIVPLQAALDANVRPTLDLAPMDPATLDHALGTGAGCDFKMTAEGDPVLAVRSGGEGVEGVVKLNGQLVLVAAPAGDPVQALGGEPLATEGLTLSLEAAPEEEFEDVDGAQRVLADLVFDLRDELTIGYRGFYRCAG